MITLNNALYFLRTWIICFFYWLGAQTFLSVIDKTHELQKVISTSNLIFDLAVSLFLAFWNFARQTDKKKVNA